MNHYYIGITYFSPADVKRSGTPVRCRKLFGYPDYCFDQLRANRVYPTGMVSFVCHHAMGCLRCPSIFAVLDLLHPHILIDKLPVNVSNKEPKAGGKSDVPTLALIENKA